MLLQTIEDIVKLFSCFFKILHFIGIMQPYEPY